MTRRNTAFVLFAALLLACGVVAAVTKLAGRDVKRMPPVPKKYQVIIERDMFGFAPRPEKEPEAPRIATGTRAFMDDDWTFDPGYGPRPYSDTGPPYVEQPPGGDFTAPADPAERLSVTGILRLDGRYKAIVTDAADGSGHYVAVGDVVAGFIVVDISAGEVTLEMDERVITLPLRRGGAAGIIQEYVPDPGKRSGAPEQRKLPFNANIRIGN